jgi:hypothetical protein
MRRRALGRLKQAHYASLERDLATALETVDQVLCGHALRRKRLEFGAS